MRKARTLKDIENHPMVESTHLEWDGCFTDSLGREVQGRWVYLHSGFICEDTECSTIHEPSIKVCCELLNNACRKMTQEEIDRAGYTPAEITKGDAIAENIGKVYSKPSDARADGQSPFMVAVKASKSAS